ncbi:hypothetical protein GGI35DRAFT_482579 [Trichoderma velutinum]
MSYETLDTLYGEAISLADQGHEFFEWLAALRRDDTHSESYLRRGEEVAYRPPNLFPSSTDTVETIKTWLQECFTTHAECQQLQNSNRPSDASLPDPQRRLHLFGKAAHPQVRLQESSSSGSFVEYIALSYCWRGDQPVQLKEYIVKSWMINIPNDQFPQTIKDAIQVAMALDLQYLWIDALYIIQDSNQDKAEQISRMTEIYE